jgi:hypothetical protein
MFWTPWIDFGFMKLLIEPDITKLYWAESVILADLLDTILHDKAVAPEVTVHTGCLNWFHAESVFEGITI